MNSYYKYVYFLVALNIVPHAFDLPLGIIMASLTFLGWRISSDLTKLPLPGKWIVLLLAFVSTLLVVNHYGTFFGDEASTAMLLMMVSLKTFEMKAYRDVMILTYLCYFLLMTKLIASQSIGMTLFMVVDVVLITAFMMMYHSPGDQGVWKNLLKRSLKMGLLALPLIGSLFLIFPRFKANLWGNPNKTQAHSGFSGELNPGVISKLMRSDEPVFRVFFKDNLPPGKNQMYWRGFVLNQSNGLSWGRGFKEEKESGSFDAPDNELVDYEIFLEPHGQKWLFTLDWPVQLAFAEDPRGYRTQEVGARSYESRSVLSSRSVYSARSLPYRKKIKWRTPDPELYLTVNDDNSEKAQSLALEIKRQSSSDDDIVKKLMDIFKNPEFSYSLNPGQMSSMDEFLFENKKGFCEHYAASLASLLRWASIPARVVLGYQGGTPSFFQDYYLIRQLDAHAWVEYWDKDDKTWVRIDPTSVVAPDRFVLGAEEFNERFLKVAEGGGATNYTLFKGWFLEGFKADILRMRLVFDQLESTWTGFLIRFDYSYQQELFSSLGIKGLNQWHLFLLCFLALLFLAGTFSWRLSQVTKAKNPAQRSYDQLCKLLAAKGLPRRANEGPLSYRRRAMDNFPQVQQELDEVFREVVKFRYNRAQNTQTGTYKRLSRLMKQKLKPIALKRSVKRPECPVDPY